MRIWHQPVTLEQINQLNSGCAVSHLGIECTALGDDFLTARMPVDARTRQPFGLLHGGCSMVLAETLASVASVCTVDTQQFLCVGQEINANHVRAVREGWVIGTARPAHLGRTSQVWEVRITDEQDKLVCISRVTMAVVPRAALEKSRA
ncbi:hotdog fold thioesterase [Brachymonas sp. G13]|uniref:hotdog fold thioesterase n=1 Tax=Brachymonas TaxID=28219 RepID=UPI0016BA1CFE|nr:hotdog fold thioesterase [Brachymonas sp. J145]MEE1653637.1 hotdog fold thioesterase [Brachymonas sp. J145]NLX16736.1 hotdog fold thioesterase [Ramlibacter sp.]